MAKPQISRIAWVCFPLAQKGGTFTHLIHWARGVNRSKFHVSLIFASPTPDDEEAIGMVLKGLDVEVMNLPEFRQKVTFPIGILKLARFVKRKHFDLIHSIYIQSDIVSAVVSSITGVPFVTSLEGSLIPFGATRTKFQVYKHFYNIVRRNVSEVIAISNATKTEYCDLFDVNPNRVHVIHSGIKPDEYEWKSSLEVLKKNLLTGKLRLGFYGNIDQSKGVWICLDAYRDLSRLFPGMSLCIIGEGRDKATLCQQICTESLDGKISVYDWLPVGKAMELFDVLMLATVREGLPWVILEAMASSKVVLATHVGGIPEVIEPWVNGILLEERTPEAIVQAIMRIQENPETALSIAASARKSVEKRFTTEQEIDQIEKIYLRVIGSCRA